MPYICSKSAIFLESNNTNGEGSALQGIVYKAFFS